MQIDIIKMKKLLAFTIAFILLVSFASADTSATMSMEGLSFIDPKIAEAVNLYACVSGGLVTCLEGKIKGRIQGEVMNSIAEAFPEAMEAINPYNQVQEMMDLGAEITEELRVDEEGQMQMMF